MKHLQRAGFAAIAMFALFSAGCMTYRTTSEWRNIKSDGSSRPYMTVQIENSGWYLFDCIPIVCGNPQKPNRNSCTWFSNTVTLQNNLNVLTNLMKQEDCTILSNLDSREMDDFYYFFLLYRRACHTSAVIFREADQE